MIGIIIITYSHKSYVIVSIIDVELESNGPGAGLCIIATFGPTELINSPKSLNTLIPGRLAS